jgi:addiction module HigA family antidote
MRRLPTQPGEILADEPERVGVKAAALTRPLDVPVNRLCEIIRSRRIITGDTALRLGHWFGTARNSGSIASPYIFG